MYYYPPKGNRPKKIIWLYRFCEGPRLWHVGPNRIELCYEKVTVLIRIPERNMEMFMCEGCATKAIRELQGIVLARRSNKKEDDYYVNNVDNLDC